MSTYDDEIDPQTGEVIGPQAADGSRSMPAAHSLADFLRMLNQGEFDAEVSDALIAHNEEIENIVLNQGVAAKIKSKLTITVDIERTADGFYLLSPDFAIKMPKIKRQRTLSYLTGDNKFTPNAPRQGQLFGQIRDVTPARVIRN